MQGIAADRLLLDPLHQQFNHLLLGFDLFLQQVEFLGLLRSVTCLDGCLLLAQIHGGLGQNSHLTIDVRLAVGEDALGPSLQSRSGRPSRRRGVLGLRVGNGRTAQQKCTLHDNLEAEPRTAFEYCPDHLTPPLGPSRGAARFGELLNRVCRSAPPQLLSD